MTGTWSDFAGNLAFVGLTIAIWAHMSIWLSRRLADLMRYGFGITSGLAAIGSTLLAVEVSPGILIDLRHAPLALAGMFGGPLSGVVAGAMMIAARLWIGGAGAHDGVITVVLVSAFGIGVHLMMRNRQPRLADVLALTVGLGVILALVLMVLPSLAAANMLVRAGPQLVVLNCLAALICGFTLFMTRRTQLERSILESAFAQSPDFIYVKDRDSRFLAVNNNMATLYHAGAPSSLLGRTDFDVMPRPIAEQLFVAEQDMMRSGKPIVDSFEQIDNRFLLASKVPLRDGEGRVVGLAGVTRDVTERTELENELRESKNLLAHAMDGMSDGFAMFDRDGHLVFCNEQYRMAFPHTGAIRIPGVHITEILRKAVETGERVDLHDADIENWALSAAVALHTNKDEEVELSNGNWLSIRTRLSEDGMAMVMVSDITARKQAETALRLAAEQLRSLAETDGLTGVLNRRAFDEAFAHEASRSARDGLPLSLLMIDIDWFKPYNDTYGHPAGDECLRQVSRCLTGCVKRPADTVARYGGEEFSVILPGTDAAGARVVAEEFGRRLEELAICHVGSPLGRVTVSVGIATGSGRRLRTEYSSLLTAADSALYAAKAQGRNRVAGGDVDRIGMLVG